jgi:hypothetical protein
MNPTADLHYLTLWEVMISEDGAVGTVELYTVMNLQAELSNYQPSVLFLERAAAKIRAMEWKPEGHKKGNNYERAAYCYVLKSDPDNPVCSNDLRR